MNLNYLEMHIVDHCNLKCNLCGHFSNMAAPSYLDPIWFESQITQLASLFDDIEQFAIMGGEPLLHPNCLEFLEISRRLLPRADIQLATNGILLGKKDERFWKSLRKYDIRLRVTFYPYYCMDRHMDVARKLSRKFKVRMGEHIRDSTNWYSLLNYDGDSDPFSAFVNCPSKVCHTLQDGRFYLCPRPAHVRILNAAGLTSIAVELQDYIDIFTDEAKERVTMYLNLHGSKPLEFCRWCPEVRVPAEWMHRRDHSE